MDNEQLTADALYEIVFTLEAWARAKAGDRSEQMGRLLLRAHSAIAELRTRPTALPVAEKYVEGFLCRAWGETDFPEVALARTREEIIAFILQAQYGDTPLAELYEENRQIIEEQIATMDLDVASCAARWEIEFEIGGISVERVTFLYAAPQPAQEGAATTALLKVLDAVRDYLPPDGIDVQAAMNRIIGAVDPWPLASPPPSPKTGEGSAIEGGGSIDGGQG
jgi:hypothetical protein